MDLEGSVLSLDERAVRRCLDDLQEAADPKDFDGMLLHKLAQTCSAEEVAQAAGRRTLVYMLHNAGVVHINKQDKNGDTALHLFIRHHRDSEVCEALLQCGADMFLMNNEGLSALEYAMAHPKVPIIIKELFKKYKPGLWRAVQDDDLMSVRKLINLWCCVDISRHGRSLKEAALDKGTEHIIRLILEIGPSMRLAHSVMAGDVKAVRTLCAEDSKLNLDFRNMGDLGATPLFYAIMQNNLTLVSLLQERGAKIDTTITFEEQDIPLYFTALNKETDVEIIRCLTPSPSTYPTFFSLHYKGRNVIQHCIENDVSPSAIRHILTQGFPQLLSARDQNNLCARELADILGKSCHVAVIDEVVHDWYLDSEGCYRRALALQGYPYLKQALKDDVTAHEVVLSMETSSDQAKFDTELDQYQDCIQRLHEAVVQGDIPTVVTSLSYQTDNPSCFHQCLANSLTFGDGQPLLIKAVLRKHTRIVEIIAQALRETVKIKVDMVRDPWYRTALHYAYALPPKGKDIIYILQDYGCSDFTMDKDCRSPLVFRDHRNHQEMQRLLDYHINQDYNNPEPNPWTIKKIPVIGHSHHCPGQSNDSKSHHHDNTNPASQSVYSNTLRRILPGVNIPFVRNIAMKPLSSGDQLHGNIVGGSTNSEQHAVDTEESKFVNSKVEEGKGEEQECEEIEDEEEEEEVDDEEEEEEEEREEEDEEYYNESEDDLIPDSDDDGKLCTLI